MAQQSGVKVDGLKESRRALSRMGGAVDKAADDALVKEATMVETKAKADAPSSHPSAPSSTAWIQRRGSKVVASGRAEPRALATEFGRYGPSRGRYRGGGGRQFRPWRGREGYVIIPAIEKVLRKTGKRVGFAAEKAITKSLNRAGVPRG